jgi:hypothetical protein
MFVLWQFRQTILNIKLQAPFTGRSMIRVWRMGQESTYFVLEMFLIGKKDSKFRNIYGLTEGKFCD